MKIPTQDPAQEEATKKYRRKRDPIIIGERFFRLVVLGEVQKRDYRRFYTVKCDCGKEKVVEGSALRSGATKSCGCWSRDRGFFFNAKHGATAAGASKNEYSSWMHMKDRCYNPSHHSWKNYGGRGIMVCDRWLSSFSNFLSDMGRRPSGYSIERNDVNGNYEPANCRWANALEQCNNMRKNRKLEYDGMTLTVAQWSRKTGLNYGSLMSRIRYGWPVERVLGTPIKQSTPR